MSKTYVNYVRITYECESRYIYAYNNNNIYNIVVMCVHAYWETYDLVPVSHLRCRLRHLNRILFYYFIGIVN